MTHQTNEELREKLDRKFNKYFEHYEDVEQSHIDKMVNEIMSLIPQPEQLEVKLKYSETFEEWDIIYHDHDGTPLVLESRITEQEALDFCKRHNLKLKVVNEEKE